MTQTNHLARLLDFFQEKMKADGRTKSEMAVFLGVAPSAVSRIFSGDRQLNAQEFLMIIDFLKIGFDDVQKALSDEIDVLSELETSLGLRYRSDNQVIAFDPSKYTAQISSYEQGGIDLQLPLQMFGNLDFDNSYLRWLPVRDDSMAPSMHPGDVIIIDASKNVPAWPGIFAVRVGSDSLMFRRIDLDSYNSDRQHPALLSVTPDNDKFKTYIVPPGRIEAVGRCLLKISRQL